VGAKVTVHSDCRVIWIGEKEVLSSYDFGICWRSGKSRAAMAWPKEIPIPVVTVREDFGISMFDI
jgi:hypothetical protein